MTPEFAIRLSGLACAALLCGAATPLLAQGRAPAYPPYPAVRTPDAVQQWVRTQTDIAPQTVVGIGADSIFSVEPGRDRSPEPYVRVVIRQEAINPDFTLRLGGRSAVMTVDLDCSGRRVFQRALELYAGSNRQGYARRLGEGAEWRDVPAGSYMDKVVEAVCTAGYRPLFAAAPAPGPATPAPTAPPYTATPAPASAPPAAYARAPAYAAPSAPAPAPGRASRLEFGRYASSTEALQAAQDLAATYPQVLAGKQRRVELSTVRGRTEFRGMVDGFASRSEAEAFCRRLQAEGRDCMGVS